MRLYHFLTKNFRRLSYNGSMFFVMIFLRQWAVLEILLFMVSKALKQNSSMWKVTVAAAAGSAAGCAASGENTDPACRCLAYGADRIWLQMEEKNVFRRLSGGGSLPLRRYMDHVPSLHTRRKLDTGRRHIGSCSLGLLQVFLERCAAAEGFPV